MMYFFAFDVRGSTREKVCKKKNKATATVAHERKRHDGVKKRAKNETNWF
jgi:hypothetical protein